MIEKIKHHSLLILVVPISIGLFFLYLAIQPDITYYFSPLFDGNQYLNAYSFFDHITDQFSVSFPFNSRILVPYLASMMPYEDPVYNFLTLNLIFTLLSVAAIYILWKGLHITQGHIMTGYFWLLIHWVGIIRYNIFDPITVDVPLYFVQVLLLFILFKRRFIWLLILGPIATIQKESFPGLLIILLFYAIYENYTRQSSFRTTWIIGLAVAISFVAKIIVAHYFPPSDPGKNSFIVILFHMKETFLNPFRFIRWLIAIFMAYGPLLMLAIWKAIKSKTLLHGSKYLLWLSLTYLFFSLFAGGDMTRIAFLGFPFIMTWIMIQLKNVEGFLFKAAFIAGIPLMKVFGTIPDPSVYGWEKFNNWHPEFANPVIILLWFVYAIMCLAMFRIIDKKLSLLS